MAIDSDFVYHNRFVKNQQEIYKRDFNEDAVKKSGIAPGKGVVSGQKGYIIALRHPEEFMDALNEVAQNVARIFPSIVYNKKNIHTTIATYNIITGQELQFEQIVMDELIQQLYRNLNIDDDIHIKMPVPNMNYNNGQFIYNSDGVILTADPDANFTDIVSRVFKQESNQIKFDIKPTWGSHITTNRFTESSTDSLKINELSEMLYEANKPFNHLPGKQPKSIDFGWFELNSKGFDLTVYESFKFKY